MQPKIINRSYDVVSLEDAKLFLHEDRNINDILIQSLIEASEDTLSKETGLAFSTTEYVVEIDGFCDVDLNQDSVDPLSVVVTYIADDGSENTLDSSLYKAGRKIEFKDDVPESDSVTITYTAGGNPSEKHITAIKLLTLILFQRNIPESDSKDINPLQIGMIRDLIYSDKVRYFH